MKKMVLILASCFLIVPAVAFAKPAKKGAPAGGHKTHTEHEHKHGEGCGHEGQVHGDHTHYMHDGHAHFMHMGDRHVAAKDNKETKGGDHYDECLHSN